METTTKDTIRCKNDAFRKSFTGGKVMLTAGVQNDENLGKVIQAVKSFDTFTEDNDPYGERDFGKIAINGEDYFWKIDYYEDSKCEYGFAFEDGKPDTAFRVLTIMLTDEY
jgi:hypothetical protein